MCFVLYIGTEKPLPRKPWDESAPDLCVESLTEHDSGIRSHFTKPEVQYVGATSSCGCDFPHVLLQKGAWPVFKDNDDDPEWDAKDRYNREKLVALLQDTGEKVVELYGVWDGDFNATPKNRESIPLQLIFDPRFFFKEQGFYRIEITEVNKAISVDGNPTTLHSGQ